jgi:tetratricopeptide (TPR) repeat protein
MSRKAPWIAAGAGAALLVLNLVLLLLTRSDLAGLREEIRRSPRSAGDGRVAELTPENLQAVLPALKETLGELLETKPGRADAAGEEAPSPDPLELEVEAFYVRQLEAFAGGRLREVDYAMRNVGYGPVSGPVVPPGESPEPEGRYDGTPLGGKIEGLAERVSAALRKQENEARLAEARRLAAEGKPGPAAQKLLRAIVIDPANVELHAELAKVYLRRGAYVEAEREAKDIIALARGRPEGYLLRGSAREARGQIREAIDDYESALAVRPGNLEASRKLEALRKRLHEMERGAAEEVALEREARAFYESLLKMTADGRVGDVAKAVRAVGSAYDATSYGPKIRGLAAAAEDSSRAEGGDGF